jgi:large subunit ribosomal protein L28
MGAGCGAVSWVPGPDPGEGTIMASGRCDVCGKTTSFGRNIRHKHSGRWKRKAPKTSRKFKPNVHKKRIEVDGKIVRVNICTSCMRTQLKRMVA